VRIEPVIAELAVVFHFKDGKEIRHNSVAASRDQFMRYWKEAAAWWHVVGQARFEPEQPD
jgi:hypothetical protein